MFTVNDTKMVYTYVYLKQHQSSACVRSSQMTPVLWIYPNFTDG